MHTATTNLMLVLTLVGGWYAAPLQAAPGFGFVPTGSPPYAQVIDPEPDGSVFVGWVDNSTAQKRVKVSTWSKGGGSSSSTDLHVTSRKIWGLKLESAVDRKRILCVLDGPYGAYRTRVKRFDDAFNLEAQIHWASDVNVLPIGRMLGGQDELVLSRCLNTAWGRRINTATLRADPWFVVQYERPAGETWGEYTGNYYDYSTTLPPRGVSGIDSVMGSDGSITTLYDFGGIRMRRFNRNGQVISTMKIDGRPYSGFQKLAKTSLDILDDQTTLLAWEWHDYYFNGYSLVTVGAVNCFRGIRADGSTTQVLRLLPESTKPDIQDTPTAGLRFDGTGAIAWTERTAQGARVWIQRLNDQLEPEEPARVVDARPGFNFDKPMLRSDGAGQLYLSWRCTSTTGGSSEIGLMDLRCLEDAPASPVIEQVEGGFRINWNSPPASEVTLWHSDSLDRAQAVPIRIEQSLPGPRTMTFSPSSPRGFFWLSTK